MDWAEFTERLARELAGLHPQMVLVVHRRVQGSHYVQAFRTGDNVHAEAVSSEVLMADLRFDPRAEDRLAELGWERPEAYGNWTFDLPFGSPAAAFRRLASIMVIALRDVQGTAAPADLVYEAFRDDVFLDLVELGLEQSDPRRPVEKHLSPLLEPAPAPAPPPEPPPPALQTQPLSLPYPPEAPLPVVPPPESLPHSPEAAPSYPAEAPFHPAESFPHPPEAFPPPPEAFSPPSETPPHRPEAFSHPSEALPYPPEALPYPPEAFSPPPEDPLAPRKPPPLPPEALSPPRGVPPAPPEAPPAPWEALSPQPEAPSASWEALPYPPEDPSASRGAQSVPPETPSAASWEAQPPLPEAPSASWEALPYPPEDPSASWRAQPLSPEAPSPSWEALPYSAEDPSASWETPAGPREAAAEGWAEPPRPGPSAVPESAVSHVPVPPVPPPVPDHRPEPARPRTNKTAIRLAEAKANGDRDGYLAVLLGAELYAAGTVVYEDGVYVRAFTAPPPEQHQVTDLRTLAERWPQPHWRLAIDDGHPDAGYLDPFTIARVGGSPVRPVMQKVLPHPLVVHYLEGGYDRVAGYVHRVSDVLQLTTPKQMYAALGLGHRGSSFSPDDDTVHVLRWHAPFTELLRPPYGGTDEAAMAAMPGGWVVEHPPFDGTGFAPGTGLAIPEFKVDSQRLPHGAEIYRFDRAGRCALVALFDADGTRWVAV